MGAARARLECARWAVGQALRVLLAPDLAALERAKPFLETAVGEVAGFQRDGAETGDTLSEARQLQIEVGRAKQLLDAALGFHQGWIRRLGGLSAGYTRSGEPACVEQGGRLIFRG
jgi:hypothetical protein